MNLAFPKNKFAFRNLLFLGNVLCGTLRYKSLEIDMNLNLNLSFSILVQMEQYKELSLLDLGSKFRSKYEFYRFLETEENLFLPPYKQLSIEFINDFLQNKKKVF